MNLTVIESAMTLAEAREWDAEVGKVGNRLRGLLQEGYQREAWRVLGYANWTACLQAIAEKHGFTERRLWQLHQANEIQARLTEQCSVEGVIIPEGHLRPLTSLEPNEQIAAWQEAVETAPNGKVTAAHVAEVVERRSGATAFNNHAISDTPGYDGDEWYTPAEYIEAARRVMGGIDLDPASCESAQDVIGAGVYYTKEDNGLARSWFGRVWLNPPYSMPLIKDFVTTIIDEYESGRVSEAIVLTNNSSDTSWFHMLLAMYPACFTRGRVQFWRPDHEAFGTRQGQVFFYLGSDPEAFTREFSQFGIVVARRDHDNQ